MSKKTSFYVWTILFALIGPWLITSVSADVPAVLEISKEIQGTNTILNLKIRHNNPSQSHYVDTIEAQVDDKLIRVDLTPQNEATFTYKIDLGQIDQNALVKVRANCNLHGWSLWAVLEATTSTTTTTIVPSTQIPPATVNMIVQIVLGAAIVAGAIFATKKRFNQHHILMVTATAVNGVSILLAMVPSTLNLIAQSTKTLGTLTLLFIPHMVTGILTMSLAIFIILKKPRKLKKWMRILFILWISSLALGTLIYITIY